MRMSRIDALFRMQHVRYGAGVGAFNHPTTGVTGKICAPEGSTQSPILLNDRNYECRAGDMSDVKGRYCSTREGMLTKE
jgi:hypothetical protein